MPYDSLLDETVLFEMPELEPAMALCARLAKHRLAWVQSREGLRLVTVQLLSEPGDLATLLRSVEEWVAERGLVAIRYEVDGRAYVLEAGRSTLSSVPA